MTHKLIETALLEQLVGALEECLDDAMQVQCDLEQSHYKNVAKTQAAQVARAKESLTAGRAALEGADRVEPDAQLCKFYGVSTYPDLVAVMEHHIRKLQNKLPIHDVMTFQRVREG